MRRLLPILVLCAGCDGDDGGGRMVFEVRVNERPDSVWISAYEVGVPLDCEARSWLELGDCQTVPTWTPPGCETTPGTRCIDWVFVEEDGVIVDGSSFDAIYQLAFLAVPGAPSRDLEVIVEGCGGSARIPVPAMTPPVPIIESAVESGGGGELTVTWSGDDATDSAKVATYDADGDGYARECRVARGTPAILPPLPSPTPQVLYVTGYTAPIAHTTELGIAHVRSAGVVSQAVP